MTKRPDRTPEDLGLEEEVTLLELVNRTIDRGVMLHGDAVISVADVDLVALTLQLCLTAVEGEGAALERDEDAGDRGGSAGATGATRRSSSGDSGG